MPLSITSRYQGTPVYQLERPGQGEQATVGLRESTPPASGTRLYRHIVTGTEDIEYLAWRYYGSSDAWWRIAEANPLIFPLDLRPGMTISIPGLTDLGRIERTRSF